MARGKQNHQGNRGSRGGYRGGRGGGGRGRGRGRGGGGGRGRGAFDDTDFTIYDFDWADGVPSSGGANMPGQRGRGRGGSGFNTPRGKAWAPNRGSNTPRGRGRPQYNTNYDDADPGMGRGRGGPVDRGRGRGSKNLSSKARAGAPLSKLLYEDRPLLRPIVFVRSVHTATLFEDEEEVFKPLTEDVANDEESHAPTAAQVNRVFGTAEDDDEDQIEEIDFSEVGRLQAEVDAAAATAKPQAEVTITQQEFTGFYIDTQPTPVSTTITRDYREALGDDDDEIVYVAPHPRAGPVTPPANDNITEVLPTTSILTGLRPSFAEEVQAIPVVEEESRPTAGEEIVSAVPQSQSEDSGGQPEPFVSEGPLQSSVEHLAMEASVPSIAPEAGANMNPSDTPSNLAESAEPTTTSTPSAAPVSDSPVEPQAATSLAQPDTVADPGPPTLEEVAFTFSKTTQLKRRLHPVRTPRSLIKTRARTRRKPPRRFSSFGASLAEAQLHAEDPRKSERRDDSDVNWGSDDETQDPVEELSNGVGDMQVDEHIDVEAMKRFAKGMSAEGSRTVTMDDIADEEMMRKEDEEGYGGGEGSSAGEESEEEDGDSEIEEIMRKEEEMLIAEGVDIEQLEGSDEEDEVTSDEEEFAAKLQRIRENAKGKGKAKVTNPPESDEDDDDDDDGEDADMSFEGTWADNDEAAIAAIQDLVDGKDKNLSRDVQRLREKLFRSIRNGDSDLDEYEAMMGRPATRKKDKGKELPPDLQKLWEQDREKKAENKRLRAQQRRELASDPLSQKKGGKKGRKAMLEAARYEGLDELPNRVTDLVSLEAQIRRFLADVDTRSMTLPPADKGTRKRIHELADAFSLKSVSKGSGNARYTTLTKTSASGLKIREGKVKRILRESGAWDWQSPSGGGAGGKKMSLAKHKEGEEVGKAAPKLTEANIGFRLLASMGWAEGDRIGLSGGLDVPLVAKMKKTKLGLGASAL